MIFFPYGQTSKRSGLLPLICSPLSGFGFSDKPQPGYGFDYTLDGKCLEPNNIQYLYLYSYSCSNTSLAS